MSEEKYYDKKEYLIAEGPYWRVWNNGIVEFLYEEKGWEEENSNQSWKDRLKFLKIWETAEIAQNYNFEWSLSYQMIEISYNGAVTFLGFKENILIKDKEMINSPSHYNIGNIETIDYIESLGIDEDFCCGNAIKYLSRYKHKENPLQDLEKAKWYLERLISNIKKKLKI